MCCISCLLCCITVPYILYLLQCNCVYYPLLFFCPMVLLSCPYGLAVLLSRCPTVPLPYCPSVQLSYCTTVLLSFCLVVLLCYCLTVLPSRCPTVPLSYCPTVFLSYCTTVLLYIHYIISVLPICIMIYNTRSDAVHHGASLRLKQNVSDSSANLSL